MRKMKRLNEISLLNHYYYNHNVFTKWYKTLTEMYSSVVHYGYNECYAYQILFAKIIAHELNLEGRQIFALHDGYKNVLVLQPRTRKYLKKEHFFNDFLVLCGRSRNSLYASMY